MEAEQRAEQRAEEDTKIRMSKIPAKLVWHRTIEYVGSRAVGGGPEEKRRCPEARKKGGYILGAVYVPIATKTHGN